MDKVLRQPTSLRLRVELLERLKVQAKASNRSLNNFIESILLDAVYREPNAETLAAIKEVESGVELETLNMDNFEKYVESL